jgi:hypothetical protein
VFLLAAPVKVFSMDFFDSGNETREELIVAAVWTIEQGIHINKTQGKAAAQKHLMGILSPSLANETTPKVSLSSYDLIGLNDSWNPEKLEGGFISILKALNYAVFAQLVYREDKDGKIYEYWRIEMTENFYVGSDNYHNAFVLAVKDKNSEKREVLHYKEHFFESYKMASGNVYRLPLEIPRLVYRFKTNHRDMKKYFIGTPLENKKGVYENGQYRIVEYNFEDQERKRQLRRARKEVKRLDSLAWWLPKEGMPLYREEGTAGLSKQLEKAYLETDIEVNESAWKSGVGKVFTLEVENKNTHYDVYLISRIKKDGETYEYWLLDGRAIDKSLDIHYRSYVFAKVAAETEERKHLEKSANPITSYTTKSGSVINLPDVDSILGIK